MLKNQAKLQFFPCLLILLLVLFLFPTASWADDRDLKWAFPTGGPVNSSPAIGDDGTIYVGSDDGNLYAINPDGTEKWAFPTKGPSSVNSSPAIDSDNTIYVGSDDYNLYAINPDGTMKWRYHTAGAVRSSPAIGSDGTIYVGSDDGHLYAINPDGTRQWRYPTMPYSTWGSVQSSPAIGSDGTIYVGADNFNLYAINPDGTMKWRYHTAGAVRSSPAIGKDGIIYVGSDDGHLHAIKDEDDEASKYWEFPGGKAPLGFVRSSPAIGSDGTIYVGSDDDNLYAINPDGTLKWPTPFQTGGTVRSAPAIGKDVIIKDGIIYVGSDDGYLYAINPDGTMKWQYHTAGAVRSSPAISAIGEDGTIYVGSCDNYLYAIEGSSGGLVDSSWPMFHHDLRHTGMTSRGAIKGMVTDMGENPIFMALVIAIGQQITFTGKDGDYKIKDLEPGVYSVMAIKKSYKIGFAATVTVVSGRATTRDFKLMPKLGEDDEDEFTTLYANYPNPLNPDTWIPYYLPQDADVTIQIYNSAGQLVRTLSLGRQVAGIYLDKDKAAYWDGKDNFGQSVASGVYFYTLKAGEFKVTRKMVIVK